MVQCTSNIVNTFCMQETIFHKILAGAIPCQKVYEDADVLAFMDIAPVVVGHTLIIPKQAEGENLYTIKAGELDELFRHAQELGPLIAAAVGAEGFTLVMNNGASAGQTVFYPHVHILPMRPGEHTPLPRCTRSPEKIAADARAIQEHITLSL